MPKLNGNLQLALDLGVMSAIGRGGDCGEVGNTGLPPPPRGQQLLLSSPDCCDTGMWVP